MYMHVQDQKVILNYFYLIWFRLDFLAQDSVNDKCRNKSDLNKATNLIVFWFWINSSDASFLVDYTLFNH